MAGDATIREARDIISRWSSNDLLDRITSLPPIPEMSASSAKIAGNRQLAATITSDDSDEPRSDFSDGRQSEQQFDDSQPHDESDDALLTSEQLEDESRSILAEINKLAQRANVRDDSNEHRTASYLKLAEIERPSQFEANVDVTDLFPRDSGRSDSGRSESEQERSEGNEPPQEPSEAVTSRRQDTEDHEVSDVPHDRQVQADQNSAESSKQQQPEPDQLLPEQSNPRQGVNSDDASPPKVTQQPEAQQPREESGSAAPSLGSLLKQSNSASVGQLAWMIDAERQRQGDQQAAVEQQAAKQNQPAASFVDTEQGDNAAHDVLEDAEQSVHSERSSQLRSDGRQTKIDLDSEGLTETNKDPVNLTASDQMAQNVIAEDFSSTQSEERHGDQSILPEEMGDDDQSGTRPASEVSQRVAQSRKVQHRQPHPRKLQKAASGLDDDDQKGMNTVSRKYRVDNPNPESVAPASASSQQDAPTANSNVNSTSRRFRIDSAESTDGMLETGDDRVRTQGRSRQRYIDEPHASAIRGPHFEVVSKKRSNMASMTGQFLAYLGVLGLTVGTAIVIYGHFGGMSEYTPTGWLVTTVAQMMLFLGVINLVSGGIEQNNDDVSSRINTLGEQLMRIEQVTEQALRGPKIAASRYADPESVPEETPARESVKVTK